MVLADNSLTVQHAHIHVYEWDDDDDEDAAEGRELPEPVIESVPLRPSTAIDFSRPPLRPRTSGDFSLPVHQRPAPCSTSSTGPLPGDEAGAASLPPSFRPGSLLTAALMRVSTQLSTPPARQRVVALRPLEDTLREPDPEFFIDITDRGRARQQLQPDPWQSESGSRRSTAGSTHHGEGPLLPEARVHGIGNAHWLITEGSTTHGSAAIRPGPEPHREQTPFIITATCAAAALLATPSLFRSLGLILAVALLCAMCALSYSCAAIVMRHAQHNPHWCFGAFPPEFFSRPLSFLARAAVLVMCALLSMLYLSVLGDVLYEPGSGLLSHWCGQAGGSTARSLTATLVMGAALFLLPPREWGSFRIISFVIIAAVCAFVSALLVTALWGVMNERGSAVSMLPLHRVETWTDLRRLAAEIAFTLPNVLFPFTVNQNVTPLMKQYHGMAGEPLCHASFKTSMRWSMAASCAVYMVASLASCIIMDPDVPGIHLNFRDDLIIPNLQVILMSPKGAVVMNIVLRSIYVVLLLASLPLALWPIHDSLGMTLDACLESWREVTAADLRHLAANYHSDASRSRAAGRLHTWLMRHPERWGVLCMRGATWAAFSAAIWATWGASGRRMEALPLTTAALLLLFCSAALAVSLVVPALLALQYPHISSAGSHFSQGRPVNAPARAPSSRLGLSPLSQWPLLGPWDPQQQQPLLQDFTWGRRSTWGSTTTADSSQHDGAGVAKAGRARATAVCALTASVVIFTAAMANLVLEYMRVSMADGRLPMQHA
mmetsp:Transcript_35775/g.91339  ORF Transcript_35775/g.91339 Transcript_35775/m.91339 type:complete len:775 (-) Transcript_35775:466-2790(-)|eukprot:jgi/Tetstr1/430536/TSEL_020334.t1